MKFCPTCGAQLEDEALFCTACGAKLVPAQPDPAVQPQEPVVQPQEPVTQVQQPVVPPVQQNQQGGFQPNMQGGFQPNTQGGFQPNMQGGFQPNTQGGFQPNTPRDERKTYSILAHIPLFWLIGLFSSPEKNDPRVRFNVGQGIIATIVDCIALVVAILFTWLNCSVFVEAPTYLVYFSGSGSISPVGILLNVLVWIAFSTLVLFYAIYGISKVSKDADAYLPIIGKFSFYK